MKQYSQKSSVQGQIIAIRKMMNLFCLSTVYNLQMRVKSQVYKDNNFGLIDIIIHNIKILTETLHKHISLVGS